MLVLYTALKNDNSMARVMQSKNISDLERRMSRSSDYVVINSITGVKSYFPNGKKFRDDNNS